MKPTRLSRTVIRRAVVVFAAALAVAAQVPTVSSASPGHHRRSADVTFTKWGLTFPTDPSFAATSLTGVVGGDVGPGAFAGTILKDDTTSRPGFWLAKTHYGFFGSTRSFVTYNSVTEDDTTTPITARIRGVVIWGWMKGASVTGEYTLLDPCPIPTPGNVFGTSCVQGSLHLQFREED